MATAIYVRSSTAGQNNEYQIAGLEDYAKNHGMTITKRFIEKKSGRTLEREQLKLMLDWVREGDTVLVYDWSRLSRNGISDLLKIVDALNDKGVTLISLKEGTIGQDATGKLILEIMASIQNWQVDIQREKQLAGIQKAKEKGVYKPRRAMVDKSMWEDAYNDYMTRKISKTEFAGRLGVTRPTLNKLITRYEGGENIYL